MAFYCFTLFSFNAAAALIDSYRGFSLEHNLYRQYVNIDVNNIITYLVTTRPYAVMATASYYIASSCFSFLFILYTSP